LKERLGGGNDTRKKPKGKNKGTYKVKSFGNDMQKGTRDDVGIVDYTEMPKKKPRYIISKGIKYRHLNEEIAAKKKALADKNFAFRHVKDRRDLILMQSRINSGKLIIPINKLKGGSN